MMRTPWEATAAEAVGERPQEATRYEAVVWEDSESGAIAVHVDAGVEK
jgi:hypothetical protein